ncbi:MAG: hypothetical protein RLZZ200_2247 [Pseudomonadota bacterium]|jgi:hypothetical protein
MTRFRAAVLVLAAGVSAAASAHHSFAVFFDDAKSLVAVRGVITGFEFKNPHGVIRLTSRDASGAEVTWKAETNSPSILERRGWTRDSLKPGDEISMEGWLARDGSRYMRMRKVVRADGTPVGVPFDQPETK